MQARLPLLAISLFALSACGGNKVRGDGPPSGSSRIPDMRGEVTPRPEKRSRYGNGPVYEVFGKRYTVMPSSSGYQERGVASWYGKKFHGNLTSNREPYDMYAMTAAHKTLPLPTYVRVRNLRNDKSIIVRVNDRGPFVHNRIIDLSYAAAIKLDMIKDGTSLVEVTAISFDPPAGDRPVRRPVGGPSGPVAAEAAPTGAEAAPTGAEAAPTGAEAAPTGAEAAPTGTEAAPTGTQASSTATGTASRESADHSIYVQVGAFGDRSNAQRRLGALSLAGIKDAFIHEERSADRVLYRVRIGPVADVVQYDVLVEELEGIGITDPYLISD